MAKILSIIPLLGQIQLFFTQLHLGKELFLLQLLVPFELGQGNFHLILGLFHLVGEIGDAALVRFDLILNGAVYHLLLCHDRQLVVVICNL